MSAAVVLDTYVPSSTSGLIATVSTAVTRKEAIASCVARRTLVLDQRKRLIRATPSIAANARIGADSIEYCMWKVQKSGPFQKRSRNDGSATSVRGDSSGKKSQLPNEAIHIRVLASGMNSSSMALSGLRTTFSAASTGPLPRLV